MGFSERGGGPSPDQVADREQARGDQPVSYEGCSADLKKGMPVDPAKMLEQKTLVTDTGAFQSYLEKYRGAELTPGKVDEIYRETISRGIVDHHSVDQFLAAGGVRSEKCATKMVVDYQADVLKTIRDNGIDKVNTHGDSDMDAICSSWLTKSLIDRGRLPAMAGELADLANRVDYGRFDVADPKVFAESLPGTIDAIKSELDARGRAELGALVFSKAEMKGPDGRLNPEGVKKLVEISTKYENLRNSTVFGLLNELNQAKAADPKLDLAGSMAGVVEKMPAEVRGLVEAGKKKLMESYERFVGEFAKADKFKARIKDKQGREMEVNMVVAESPEPLTFTNLAYNRTSPDTIVAVYAGKDRKAGDNYDIGITPDMANAMDLRGLCLALNGAERQAREAVYAKPAESRTEEEKKLVEAWDKQKAAGQTRKMFGDIDARLKSGEAKPEDVVDIDPTVLVAADSLIAASRTSLLPPDKFREIMRKFETGK